MKTLQLFFIIFIVSIHLCQAQDTTIVLTAKQFKEDHQIALTNLDGWMYKAGNDISRAQKNQDDTGWKRMKPEALSTKDADTKGKVEGWFYINIQLDSSFKNIPLGIKRGSWATTDIY